MGMDRRKWFLELERDQVRHQQPSPGRVRQREGGPCLCQRQGCGVQGFRTQLGELWILLHTRGKKINQPLLEIGWPTSLSARDDYGRLLQLSQTRTVIDKRNRCY